MSMNSFHARQAKSRPPVAPNPAHAPSGPLRADVLLVQQGLAASRSEAQAFIKAGRVSQAGRVLTKPAQELPAGTSLTLTAADENPCVSRGGLKLAGA
ncbi:MAG: TlyA family rRNA (cytidine-2'-O)-methyltransferase, partial [Azoarcus sp.]|nr:TlyA family rRNA (cytidine-2'-O)-methyltransferase [Azoarcus sp.]